eukprot:6526177-Pyramimonas_sp.AAC.1
MEGISLADFLKSFQAAVDELDSACRPTEPHQHEAHATQEPVPPEGAAAGGEAAAAEGGPAQGTSPDEAFEVFMAGDDPGGLLGSCQDEGERKRLAEAMETIRTAKRSKTVGG